MVLRCASESFSHGTLRLFLPMSVDVDGAQRKPQITFKQFTFHLTLCALCRCPEERRTAPSRFHTQSSAAVAPAFAGTVASVEQKGADGVVIQLKVRYVRILKTYFFKKIGK